MPLQEMTRVHSNTIWLQSWIAALVLMCVLPGASAGQVAVTGTVYSRGRPAVNAVVYMVPTNGKAPLEQVDTVVIDQTHLRFSPTVVAVQVGSTIRFENSDPNMHNVFSPAGRGAGFDLGTYPEHESRSFTFTTAGHYVVLCHVHPEMAAWVVVTAGRSYDVTGRQGEFAVGDLRPGRYRLLVWHRASWLDHGIVAVGGSGRAQTVALR